MKLFVLKYFINKINYFLYADARGIKLIFILFNHAECRLTSNRIFQCKKKNIFLAEFKILNKITETYTLKCMNMLILF